MNTRNVFDYLAIASYIVGVGVEQLYAHIFHLHRPWDDQIHNRGIGV